MWRIQISKDEYIDIDAESIQVVEEESLMYLVDNPKDMVLAETVAVFKLNDIIGAYKYDGKGSSKK